jgi:hypothetical protein
VENLKAQLASIKGTENEDPAIVKDLESRIAKAGQAQAAPPGEASYTPPSAQPAPAPAPKPTDAAQVGESVGFQNDELNRLVSLVHYR